MLIEKGSKEVMNLLSGLYGEVKMSKCCEAEMSVIHGENMAYYICKGCHKPCEPRSSKFEPDYK